jgi:Na+-translocating ferredoxin:NAD+ oxidoreductase RnfG subunit
MMKANIFVFTPAALLGSAVAGHGVNYMNVAQAQQAIFPGKAMTAAEVKLTSEQRKAIEKQGGIRQRSDTVKAWRVAGGGWFIVDEVLGKHEFITFAMGISADGSVHGIEIMEYLETYGDEVRNPKWRAQFTGKTKSAPLQLDKDIRNISGATLSSRHITDGVHRLLAIHDVALKSR